MNQPKVAVATVIATWFGCGFFPIAPGTVGSAAAVVLAAAFYMWKAYAPLWLLLPTVLLLFPGIWAAGVVADARGKKDPGLVVVDEVLGQWITLMGATVFNWKSWLLAFFLFRAFDIWKPYPIRNLEALPSGTGIVADDLLAGLYAALVLFVLGCLNLY
ncbi:MAG: phosphatidylglycerophosphatase A [Acidobacteriaceae bacterium]|nr:phosphatidylglycerophosphatase A [Acidobacteriaceae bacterium]